jgi:CubicO group peptidase (beta-lactamase class C family)
VWEPGTQTGYHTLTYGWILGEIIRRIDGRSLGAFFRDEVAGPLGLDDVSIGVAPERHARIPTILPNRWPDAMPDVLRDYMQGVLSLARDPSTPAGISCLARDGVGALDRIPELFNNAPGRTAELGGSNLAGNAPDVARIFAAIAEGGLVSSRSVELFTTVRNEAPDLVLLMPVPRALGYWTNKNMGRPQAMGPNEEAFGHTGAGGQIGFCDPVARVGAGFVRSHYTVFPYVYMLLNGALFESIAASG